MQTCLSRYYLKPVRNEEAESQRKAKSRQARQTRRSTQGVTLSELKDVMRSFDSAQLDKYARTGGVWSSAEGLCGQTTFPWEKELGHSHAVLQQTEQNLHTCSHGKLNEEGHVSQPGNKNDRFSVTSQSASGACGFTPCVMNCASSSLSSGVKWKDENENTISSSSQVKVQDQWTSDDGASRNIFTEHDRISRSDSSGMECSDRLNRTSSYTRRENRSAKTDDDTTSRNYKKLYEDALAENEKLKVRLENSKEELTKIRSQLDIVMQKKDRTYEKPTVLESEKREKQALEKRVSDMEEELKILTELKSDNQRLKDENGALIRVISKLSK